MPMVSIITGGAGGMGFATAKVVGRDHHVVICDVSQQRLDAAAAALRKFDINCDVAICDVTDRRSVQSTFELAASKGHIVSVIHAAGISPQMAGPDIIMSVNAVGTINVVEASHAIASDGFALVCVASMAAYMLPDLMIPKRSYSYALSDLSVFLKKTLFLCRLIPRGLYRNGYSYAVSKNFVIWYCRKNAEKFGRKNARVLSISPGSFDTEMGRLEEKSGSVEMLKKAALKRLGRPEEIAELLAFCASSKAGYLTGVDVLCDGGVIASRR